LLFFIKPRYLATYTCHIKCIIWISFCMLNKFLSIAFNFLK